MSFSREIPTRSPCREVAKVLDYDLEIRKFELQLLYYIHFRTNTFEKSMNPLISLVMGWIVTLQFFYKDDFGFGIKYPENVDTPLNKITNWIKKLRC